VFGLNSCQNSESKSSANEKEETLFQPASLVNPFIGTQNMGHTFPGATMPFGMVQLSPETNFQPFFTAGGEYNKETYRYCSGYQYDDSLIYGFTHTHFSGTGHSDLGDLLLMPLNGMPRLEPALDGSIPVGQPSPFSHKNECAEPGYYQVLLDQHGINAELTATERVGIHQYTFSKADSMSILLDMIYSIYHHDDKNVWSFVRVENDSTITGYRQTNGWGRTRFQYFALRTSLPIVDYGHRKYEAGKYNGFYRKFSEEKNFPEMAGKNIRAWFSFGKPSTDTLLVKFALSSSGMDGAIKNLESEARHNDFKRYRESAYDAWNKELSKIKIESLNPETQQTFYTALYHTMLSPVIYEDVDGVYRGLDQNNHRSEGFENYTVFSLWDTFRAQHPLHNLLHPARSADMINAMLAHQQQSVHGMLPIWSHYANENWCMVGYHATSVIADALAKNIRGFDKKAALNACTSTASVTYFDGLENYIAKGYVAEDLSSSSVSKTLEYAYNDWCIQQIALENRDDSTAAVFQKRAGNWKNLYHPESGFMRPKNSDGSWKDAFDPMDTHGQGFIEGNAWNYGLFVPHDVPALINKMGGERRFTDYLDSLFVMQIEDKYIEKNEDITRDGIIGNYVHGNEPGHHIPYLYNWTGNYWKTQERVRMIMDTMYGPGSDGLCGNDDAGQMSAWYVFSALGFYPVCPGSEEYAIGSPLVKSAELLLENGRTVSIKTIDQSEKAVYVKEIRWNDKKLDRPFINHSDLMRGGELMFFMSESAFN
jgi:predicted alpha-1,2-mannosidase